MRRFALPMMMVMNLGACTATTAGADGDGTVPPHAPLTATCDAARAQSLVGQQATAQIGADIQRLSGAVAFRWLSMGQAVTMEYRADRVNVRLDARNAILGITCG